MRFYTSVARIGNNIVYRGYENGIKVKKRFPFKPTMFVTANRESDWQTLTGEKVVPRVFDTMKEATDFSHQYENVSNMKVYGINNFVSQFIYDQFPNDISFERDTINVATIDIEVASDDGFPHPEEANKEVISICLKNNQSGTYFVWGLGDYDSTTSIVGEENVRYIHCDDEVDLLQKFIGFWSNDTTCPDVVTGWNSRLFDLPYLINRMQNILEPDAYKKMSPWGMVREKKFALNGRHLQAYDIVGIEQLDYYDLFQKFGVYSFGVQESYKLDHIANVVLGEKKLSYEEFGNLYTLYKHDYQKFIDYNIKDVQLVERIEDKMGLITLAMTMGYKAGCNYTDSFGTTALWDTYIYRSLTVKKVVVPQKDDKPKQELPGGFVKSPHIGRHSWVVSFDLNSLYPHLMLQYNMSPETVMVDRTSGVSVQNCLNKTRPESRRPDCAIAANGAHFRKDFKGVIPTIIDGLYSERKGIKRQMLSVQQKIEEEGTSYEYEKMNTTLDTQQMAIKIMMNSLYGAIGNRWFRYYDHRIAEAITTSGQLSILWAEKTVNDFMNKILETENVDYVIAIDTDSVYINFGPLVEKFNLEKNGKKDAVQKLDQIARDQFEPLLQRAYSDLSEYMNAFENRMVMGREAIADAGIWTAKKRYILNVHNNEGVQYKTPKLKIMGIEAVKSSTPNSCRTALKELFKVIISSTEKETQQSIRVFKDYFKSLPPHEVAFPRGAKNITGWKDDTTVYQKGTPIHVRGSLLFNKLVVDKSLEKRYNVINDGDKVKFTYLKVPNPISENIIAFSDFLPEEFGLHDYVDYETQFEKAFLKVVEPVLEAIGWTAEPQATLDEFFG